MGMSWTGVGIACAAGVLLAAAYDVLRIVRLLLSGKKRAVVAQDFFFMILAAFVTYLASLAASFGVVRFYVLACEAIGACVYFLTLGLLTERLARGLHCVLRWIARFLWRFFFHPLQRFFCAIGRWIGSKWMLLNKKTKKSKKNPENGLKPHGNMVYNRIMRLRRKPDDGGTGGTMQE